MKSPRIVSKGEGGLPNGRRTRASKGRKNERGVALIIAVISIAILTMVATEFVYNSRVDLQMAANQRDDSRAYYMARSGVGMARLLLSFQSQIDNIKLPPELGAMLGMTGGGDAPALKIDLWKMARVDCYMLQGLVDSSGGENGSPFGDDGDREPAEGEIQAPGGQRDFGGFTGCFDVKIESENEKINLNGLQTPGTGALIRALTLVGDEQWQFLFEEPDSNRIEVSPVELVTHINDWLDEDEVGAALDLNTGLPKFIPGFSDENGGYSRLEPRYEAKNAEFDSLDELFMVHGMSDKFMAAFRDRFTVYLNKNEGMNINTTDPMQLIAIIQSVADPRYPDPRLQDPVFMTQVLQSINQMKSFLPIGFDTRTFLGVLQSHGIKIRPEVLAGGPNSGLTDKNTVFTLKATGEAGAIKKKITAVVNMKDQRANGGMGRLVYWREE